MSAESQRNTKLLINRQKNLLQNLHVEVEFMGIPYGIDYSINDYPFIVARLAIKQLNRQIILPRMRIFSVEKGFAEEGEVSVEELHFAELPEYTEVEGWTATRPGFESRGFGTALALLSDAVIPDVAKKYPHRIKYPIVSIVDDIAKGQENGKRRSGWSNKLAEQLGYKEFYDEEQEFYRMRKIFRT